MCPVLRVPGSGSYGHFAHSSLHTVLASVKICNSLHFSSLLKPRIAMILFASRYVGKSSITERFINGSVTGFVPLDLLAGIAKVKFDCSETKIEVYDAERCEHFGIFKPWHIQRQDGFILVYGINDRGPLRKSRNTTRTSYE